MTLITRLLENRSFLRSQELFIIQFKLKLWLVYTYRTIAAIQLAQEGINLLLQDNNLMLLYLNEKVCECSTEPVLALGRAC